MPLDMECATWSGRLRPVNHESAMRNILTFHLRCRFDRHAPRNFFASVTKIIFRTVQITEIFPASSTSTPSVRRQALALLLGVIFLAVALMGLWRWKTTAFPVLVEIDGQKVELTTHASSPEALLRTLGYVLRPEDALEIEGVWGTKAQVAVHRARPVQVLADGHSRIVWTRAQSIGGLLETANLAVGTADEIFLEDQRVSISDELPPAQWRPPAGRRSAKPWQQIPTYLTLTLLRAVPVLVVEEGGISHTIWTRAKSVEQALAENDIPVYVGDELLPGRDAAIQPGMRVLLLRATPISVSVDGRTIDTRTRENTVGGALRALGIWVQGEDRVHPALDAELHPDMTILVTRVEDRLEYEEELLPFDTVWEPDDELIIDARRVGNAGRPGILRRRYRVHYEDGREISRELEDEWVAQEPERKIILYGRKIVPRTAMTPDGPITYWRKIRAYTTSYSPARSGTDPSLPWYGRTRLGFKAGKGVVGVDPSVINMSQKMYVPGYGFAIAGDTGSGLSGRHVDLGFSDTDYESWHWWSDVYLLWPPPPNYAITWVLPDWPRYKGSRNPYVGLVQEEP